MPLVLFALLLAGSLLGALHDDAEFTAATDRYRDLDYEQALLTFERLSVRTDLTAPEKAEVLLWMALCHDGVGNASAADRMMGEALARDRAAMFPVKASPSILQRLETIRAALPTTTEPVSAPAPTPSPSPAEPAPTTTGGADPGVPWAPIAATGAAGLALVGAGVLATVAGVQWSAANDAALFADERQGHYRTYVGTAVGAGVLGVVGVAAAGAAGYLWITRSEP